MIASKDDPATQKSLLQNSTQINIVPVSPLEYSGGSVQPATSGGPPAPSTGKGTTVVITTKKGPLPTQVVLNFPVDAGMWILVLVFTYHVFKH